MNKYSANSKAYAEIENIGFTQFDNLTESLEIQLEKSIDFLDLTIWQKGKLREVGMLTIGQVLCEIADTEQVERLLKIIGDKEYLTKELMELLGLRQTYI